MSSNVRPNVLKMQPYQPGKPIEEVKREFGLDSVVKLASNENPIGPSPKAVAAVRAAAEQMHIYPDGGSVELRTAIAKKFGVQYDQVLLGNGSDELIHLVGLLFMGSPQHEVIMGDPSFARFDPVAHLANAKLIKVRLDDDYKHDLTAMAKAITPNTRLVFVANPNNPTGTIVRKPEVDAFLKDLPSWVTLVLDEAYYEFAADEPGFPCSLDYIAEGIPNVIGLRTFSKAYGLAGIRIGYGFAQPEITDAVNRAREPFDINSLAQAAAIAALDDQEHARMTVENNRRGLLQLREALLAGGARPMESFANFIYADLGRPAKPVFEEMLRCGVITRAGNVFGDPNGLRVSVGTEEELRRFAEVFLEVMQPAVVG